MTRIEREILDACGTGATQAEVAAIYARGLPQSALENQLIDWARVNGEIIERWSVSGLGRVKKMAWDSYLAGGGS